MSICLLLTKCLINCLYELWDWISWPVLWWLLYEVTGCNPSCLYELTHVALRFNQVSKLLVVCKAYKFLECLLGSRLGRGIRLRMVKLGFRALGFDWVIFVDYFFFFQYLKHLEVLVAWRGEYMIFWWFGCYEPILKQMGNEVLTMKV